MKLSIVVRGTIFSPNASLKAMLEVHRSVCATSCQVCLRGLAFDCVWKWPLLLAMAQADSPYWTKSWAGKQWGMFSTGCFWRLHVLPTCHPQPSPGFGCFSWFPTHTDSRKTCFKQSACKKTTILKIGFPLVEAISSAVSRVKQAFSSETSSTVLFQHQKWCFSQRPWGWALWILWQYLRVHFLSLFMVSETNLLSCSLQEQKTTGIIRS